MSNSDTSATSNSADDSSNIDGEQELLMVDTGLPVATELAEMLLTKNDLKNSLLSFSIWVERYAAGQGDEKDRAINGSLFRDGVTQFVGCFDSKNAYPLVVETVYPNTDGVAPYFRWLRDLRNSYTAHRHGSARQCNVAAVVQPETGKFLGQSELFAVYTGPSADGHSQLLAVVAQALRYAETKIAELKQQFIAEASAIAPEKLLALPRGGAVQPQGPASMAKSRGDVRKTIAREAAATPPSELSENS
ncbi:hypothetical protein [Bradyrhizobium diazoefficiens]|uniref:hypothetical protein n=1 Tax=Bradyrhizobium diazoefficiens TaxID=1355477 RepID=UPI002714723D|nr:hypothetical protein [Bradyrhizobium diazoefficiens]WLA53183.1 hypothetical protein QIH81_21590 [Bradyrhizobium diazoefficiens]